MIDTLSERRFDGNFSYRPVGHAALASGNTGLLCFSVSVNIETLDQVLFVGLLDRDHRTGIGLGIDPMGGAVIDVVNGQSVIDVLERVPHNPAKTLDIAFSVEKIGYVYIPTISIGGERIIHPSLYLRHYENPSALVGSTVEDGAAFTNPQLTVNMGEESRLAS